MRKIKAELIPLTHLEPADQRQFTKWVWDVRDANDFDLQVIGYPRTCMAKASYDDGTPLAYVPVQPVLMFESLACDPNITKSQKSFALYKVLEEMKNVMSLTGMHETYVSTKDDAFAERLSSLGFEEVKGRVFKLKHKTTELPKPLVGGE